ncbi:nucleotide exchange factor GrpE [Bordetella sp. FB-8]|uniref:nucleotide exchange factor GrpE n=1 Tax=Bordetella sp. FB-8 TaxID=1159870 RepID=UPI00036DB0BC|nr:nucleotide exchange factor GrpE [Bordetella sp. FB-8]
MTAPQEPIDPSLATQAGDDLQTELNTLRAELESVQSALQTQQDQVLRAMAEAENVRRRAQEDVSKARKFGIESFAEGLVPVKDSLEAALAQTDQTVETLREGVQMTLRQLASAFERNLLKEIAPAQGDKFDPHQHQAISSVPAEQPANTVVQVLQKGYAIADRTLRPALVVVSAGQ